MIKNTADYKEELQHMSLSDLENMINEAELVAKAERIDTKRSTVQQIMDLAAQINMKVVLTSLTAKPTKRGLKIKIKYRDPDNINHVWSGRGVYPVWLRNKLQAGHELSKFLIK